MFIAEDSPLLLAPDPAPGSEPTLRLRRISISPGHNHRGHHGGPPGIHPLLDLAAVRCLAGCGLEGDRHAATPDATGQVTLIAMEDIAAVARALGRPTIPLGVFRRNLLVAGGTLLHALIGRRCSWMDQAIAPGAAAALAGRGGLRCRVLTDGWLHAEPA